VVQEGVSLSLKMFFLTTTNVARMSAVSIAASILC
jgi:hypothetical protein